MRNSLTAEDSTSGTADEAVGQQVSSIVDRISSAISLGMITVGERLPVELELASQFGVAVATLRKALARMRSQGIVETRRGRNGGTFVVKAPFPSSKSLRQSLARTSIASLRDLADEHAAISGAAARLAAQRTAPTQSLRLAELAFRPREARGSQERSLAESRFHIEIAVLSHSQRLLTSEQRLQSEVAPLLWNEDLQVLSTQLEFNKHLQIVMAIEQGRAEEAQLAAEQHVMENMRHIVQMKLELPESLTGKEQHTRTTRARSGI